jgi:hypothetical protein
MHIENKEPTKLISLTVEEKERLERLAPYFDLNFRCSVDAAYELIWIDDPAATAVRLTNGTAHVRLLIELCARTAPWLYFHFGESCQRTLFRHSDTQLMRIAELYAKKRNGDEE